MKKNGFHDFGHVFHVRRLLHPPLYLQALKTCQDGHFSCFVMVGGGELPKHEEHTLMGVFFMVWEVGMGGGGGAETQKTRHFGRVFHVS